MTKAKTVKKQLDTPYNRIGPRIVDMGYSAIPILPGEKFPGKRGYGEWVAETGWQRYCDRAPTSYETSAWSTWPDAGVCVALGFNGVVAIDIDTTDVEMTEAIMSILPDSPVAKRGQKGRTLFFRANTYREDAETGEVTGVVKSKPYDVHRERVVDLLCHGRQTVVPPSIHPDTHRAYEWITEDTLEHISPEDLPLLPDDIAQRLVNVLTPFGYVDIPDMPALRSGDEGDPDTPWAEVNRLARENFDVWVPDLYLPATKRNYRGTYRAAAAWRGGDGPNVSFHPKGIKDMKADKSYSALDVVMLATGSSLDAAFRWLAPRVGYRPPEEVNVTALLEAQVRKNKRASLSNEELIAEGISFVSVDDEKPETAIQAANDNIEDLTHPGGKLEGLVDWIVSSSPTPSRSLALSAAIPLLGAMVGRRYSTGERDTRANIYTVALAESGFGKEHARSQIKRLMLGSHGVFDKYAGPARIMSASALREVLEQSSCVNCMIDEFGGFVREITDKRAGGHQKAISTDLRDYYSASSTFFEGAAYRGTPAKKIYNPMLCIYGTSTPEQFWSALSSASAEDGLLPRLLLFNIQGAKPKTIKPPRDIRDMPEMLMKGLADMAGIDVAATRLGNIPKSAKAAVSTHTHTNPYIVPWSDGAQRRFGVLQDRVNDEEALVVPEAKPFVRRILETATKLALIAAVSVNHDDPVISENNMDWAARLAWSCAQGMIVEVADRMADNVREANYKRIASIIKKSGASGIANGRLIDRIKGIDTRQRDEILKDLKETGHVREEMIKTSGRPKARLVWC